MKKTRRSRLVACVASVALLGTGGCTAHGGRVGAVAAEPIVQATIPATDLTRVALRVRDGTVQVTAGRTDEVSVALSVSGADCERGSAAVSLRHQRSGATLELDAAPSTKDRCDEHWRLEIPVAMLLDARGDRVDMEIRGIGGGVVLNAGKGTLDIDVPAGDIEAVVQNGHVRAGTATSGYGNVRLATQVGRVQLRIDGRPVRHPRPAGPGDWIEVGGNGGYRVSLRATVGSVRLDVGAMR